MHSFDHLLSLTDARIASLALDKEPGGLYHPIRYALDAGGKRIRPVALLMACDLFGGDIDRAWGAAMAVEVFHNFTLLHDDIMDNTFVRRGQPSVHARWDRNTAILSGDAMLIYAYEQLMDAPAQLLRPLTRIFNKFGMEVCEGQQYDMDFERRDDVTEAEYLDMIRLKTSVLIAGAMQMGALVGGAPEAEAARLYDFGLNMGMAFQLRDDILDTYGNPATFGKKIGGDIASNKKTILLVSALASATGDDLVLLRSLLDKAGLSQDDKFDAVKSLYDKLGVKEQAERLVGEFALRARAILDGVDAAPERKAPLGQLVEMLSYRDK